MYNLQVDGLVYACVFYYKLIYIYIIYNKKKMSSYVINDAYII